jgi:hypothetical protein
MAMACQRRFWRIGTAAGGAHHLRTAQKHDPHTAIDAMEEEGEQAEFIRGFDELPASVQVEVYKHIATEPGFTKLANRCGRDRVCRAQRRKRRASRIVG